jgi:hypothetical protein
MVDFSDYIHARTHGFVCREWVFDALNAWLEAPTHRTFVLTGDPGTGKSALAARVVQMSLGEVDAGGRPRLGKGSITYHHFCQDGVEETLSPLTFVQALSETLANRYPAFREALERAASRQIVINSVVNTGAVAPGAQVSGVAVTIEIKGSDARTLFDEAVRKPLQSLVQLLPGERIAILVDSLDEALLFNPESNIARLLKLAADFPPEVRFVVTARSKSDRVFEIVGAPTLDLVRDAPPGIEEVKVYVRGRLAPVPDPPRDAVVLRVAEASNDNFLYAYHVLNDLLAPGRKIGAAGELDLPTSLEDVYRKFLERELADDTARWTGVYRPLLGAIAVARGAGLTRAQLVGITQLPDDKADDVLKVCRQYLAGGGAQDAPYRIYHQSFREFLLRDETYSVYPAERHAEVAQYLENRFGASWGKCNDDYALRHTPTHWAEAAMGSTAHRESRTRALLALTGNARYRQRFELRIGELPLLRQHLERAVQLASQVERDQMLPQLLGAVRTLERFGTDYLRGESVVQLAEAGQLERAEGRLSLFTDLDADWMTAAQLILAWLACERDPAAAAQVHARVAGIDLADPLRLLRDRLGAAIAGAPTFQVDVGQAHGLELGTAIVRRMSGQWYDEELLSAVLNPSLVAMSPVASPELIGDGSYGAAYDAPILVQNAAHFPVEGTVQLEEYIRAHAGYNYVEYRNRSLWIVLDAVVRHHPDQAWVRQRLSPILVAALTGGGVDYREMLPMTAAVLLERARGSDGRALVDDWRQAALDAANALEHYRHANDTWGSHKRRLTALMELHALVLGDAVTAQSLCQRIGVGAPGQPATGAGLPFGFAGYQAPATLRLADGLRAAGLGAPATVSTVLDAAIAAAHNVQDYHFSARVTARCHALRRWHDLALDATALAANITALAAGAGGPEFAADHAVGEPFAQRREEETTLSIAAARSAATLEELVEVFQRPAVELRRQNPEYGLAERLAPGTRIRIPDPGLAPLLAVHLAARALAEPALENCGALCRSLVPVAAANPTALDTVLAYALISAQLEDVKLLTEVADAAGPVVLSDEAAPAPAIRPPIPG